MDTIIPSLNYHITNACNMKCKYCHSHFDSKNSCLRNEQQLKLIELIANSKRFEKFNIAGGEPTLVGHLPELIQTIKGYGFYTSIVCNGSNFDEAFVKKLYSFIDLIGISIDTVNPQNQLNIDRCYPGMPLGPDFYLETVKLIDRYGIKLKINTVVCSINQDENMSDFIIQMRPYRWKIFQVMCIEDQNKQAVQPLLINDQQFRDYVQRHTGLKQYGIEVIAEDSEIMKGSYVMIDPLGRFFDNTTGQHRYSRSILEVGVEQALTDIQWDYDKFTNRKGDYWKK